MTDYVMTDGERRYPKDAPLSYQEFYRIQRAINYPKNRNPFPSLRWTYEDVVERYPVAVIAWAEQYADWYNQNVDSVYDSWTIHQILVLAHQVQSDPAALDRWRQERYDQHWDYQMSLWYRSLWYGLLAGFLSAPFWFAGTLAYASHPAIFHQKNIHATIYSILTGLGVAGVSRWIQWKRKAEDIKSWLFAALLLGPVLIFVAFLL
ncbi:hypothetical protein SAMN00768000_3728 [Sulfobacillus thermosulfidooxidans DSM 9293]|uniref:Uncharacterized protein n=1 Tax=Sulfobacillus thermosulfidooxidans (strain DSM 9293 / VKM B-1269 / AT-1) TaxID=929705 RepID=A0A1W1WPQ4_SULTA|nr:hypothetical protein [Sulfobacillus thermosulfidooxidans]SMC08189.1 hypothetical protein SAMN00768000_3728 [Sulfobacillus thermosulfidooxidans DSM 9293]